MTRQPKSLWLFVLILAGLVTVTVFYFVAHKPASAEQLTALARWLPGLMLSGLIALVAAGVGHRFVRSWGESHQRAMLSLGLGLGLYSGLTLLLGLIGWLNAFAGWALLIVGALVGRRQWRPWWIDLRETFHGIRPASTFARVAAVYSVTMLAVALLQALTPTTAWDGLAYHLVGPEIYLANGRITHPIDLAYLGFPQFGEMLFLYARLLGSQVPAVMHWLFAAMTTVLVAGEAQRLWKGDAGWIAAAIFLSAETVILEAGWPYIDLMLAFQTLAAIVCLLQWHAQGQVRALVLAGVFTGFAAATKYSAASLLVGIIAALLFQRKQERWRPIMLFSVVVALIAVPWYLKNWLVEGNPFYTMLSGGLYWDAIRGASFSRPGTGLAFTAPWQLLSAPWDMTIWGVEGKVGYAATLGPLFLMLLPIVLLSWRALDGPVRSAVKDILLVSVGIYVVWLAGLALSEVFLQARLLIPLLPGLALVGAGAFPLLQRFDRPGLSLKRLAVVLTSIVLLATGLKTVLDVMSSGTSQVLVGAESPDAYLNQQLGWYHVAMQSLGDLGSDARVQFLWEPRSLYCQANCWPDALLDRWWHARRTLGSADQIAAAWQAAGIQYLLLNRAGYEAAIQLNILKPTDEDQQALQDLITHHLQLVRTFGTQYELYRWQSAE